MEKLPKDKLNKMTYGDVKSMGLQIMSDADEKLQDKINSEIDERINDNYIYVDATAEGAKEPHYIHNEARIEKIKDDDKKEELFNTNINVDVGDVLSNNDVELDGGLLTGLLGEGKHIRLSEAKEIEYISQEELDKIPADYKTTVGDTIKNGWEGTEKLTKMYRDLGYEDADPMILARTEKGTVLKPVKVKKEEGLELDDEETKFINNMITKTQAEVEDFLGYDLTPTQFEDKQSLRLAIKEIYEQMPDEELNKFQERFLGPDDATIEDSKRKGLYSEDKKVEDAGENKYEFKAGYYEWHLLKNGKIIAVFNDFVEELPEKCTEENLRDFIDSYLLTPSFKDEEDFESVEDYEASQEFNEAIEGADREKIIDAILDRIYYEYGELDESKKVELSHRDLEELANDIIDWYASDMGTWFDEIQGNEEEIYDETIGILESKDKDAIQHMIDEIEMADIDDETADAVQIKTTSNLVSRLKKLL